VTIGGQDVRPPDTSHSSADRRGWMLRPIRRRSSTMRAPLTLRQTQPRHYRRCRRCPDGNVVIVVDAAADAGTDGTVVIVGDAGDGGVADAPEIDAPVVDGGSNDGPICEGDVCHAYTFEGNNLDGGRACPPAHRGRRNRNLGFGP